MPTPINYLDITLLGKEFRVSCPPEEKDALLRAAAYVDGKMREIAEQTHSDIGERVAVMAALSIAHEFLSRQNQSAEENPMPEDSYAKELDIDAVKRRIAFMEEQLDALLEPQDKLI